LKSMKKPVTPEQINRAIKLTMEAGLSIQGNFIFGDVAETEETIRDTMAFWKGHAYAGINLFFIIACPNSVIYRHCVSEGIIQDELDFVENHLFDTFNMTSIPDQRFFQIRDEISFAPLRYNIRSIPKQIGEDHITVRCPHCRDMITYRNFTVRNGVVPKYQ